MYFIVEVQGCLPNVEFIVESDTGDHMVFDTREEAEACAKENCTWGYQIIEF